MPTQNFGSDPPLSLKCLVATVLDNISDTLSVKVARGSYQRVIRFSLGPFSSSFLSTQRKKESRIVEVCGGVVW